MNHRKNTKHWWLDWTTSAPPSSTPSVQQPPAPPSPKRRARWRKVKIALSVLAACIVLPITILSFFFFVSDPWGVVWWFGAGKPQWSPDGKQIVFRCDQDDIYDGAVCVRRADRDERRVIRPWQGFYNGIFSVWSLDGTKILSSGFGVRLLNPDGTGERELSGSGWNAVWSPDGTRIAFASSDGLFVMRDDGSQKLRIFLGSHTNPAWSPDGKRLLISTGGYDDNDSHLLVVSADGNSPPQRLGPGSDAAWSPDGKRIAFILGDSVYSMNASVYTMNADGSGRRRWTMGTPDRQPRFLPGGKSLVYLRDGYDICLLSLKDGNIRFVAHGLDPSLSPNGKRIAFVGNRGWGLSHIQVMDLENWDE